eukprot:766808-Hanusia_phi.AAC.6
MQEAQKDPHLRLVAEEVDLGLGKSLGWRYSWDVPNEGRKDEDGVGHDRLHIHCLHDTQPVVLPQLLLSHTDEQVAAIPVLELEHVADELHGALEGVQQNTGMLGEEEDAFGNPSP